MPATTTIDYLANHLDNKVKYHFLCRFCKKWSYGYDNFFSNSIAAFRSSVSPKEFKDALNHTTFERGYGTFASVIVNMVFYPHLYSLCFAFPPADNVYQIHLSKEQLHDIMHTTFMLIAEDGLNVNYVDYHGHTPSEMIRISIATLGDIMSPTIKEHARCFWRLMHFGQGLVLQQQHHVKEHIKRQKMKRAVRYIESWWFNVVNSPYTDVGRRVMEKRAIRFANDYNLEPQY